MKDSKIKLAVFYCQHRRDVILQLFSGLDDPGGVNVRQVALPCSGKLEIFHLTKALENGADGVAIFGCPEQECHYIVGSQRAKGRVRYTEKILKGIGMEEDRVQRFVFAPQPSSEDREEFSGWLEKVRAMKALH